LHSKNCKAEVQDMVQLHRCPKTKLK